MVYYDGPPRSTPLEFPLKERETAQSMGDDRGIIKRNKKKISRSQLRWTRTIYLDLEISLYAMYIRIKPIGDVCPH